MQADAAGRGERFLVCRVGGRRCALPIAQVAETMRPLPLEPVAGAPAFLAGLAVIRGTPTPVVDAAALLGAAAEPPGRFVTLKARERQVALAVAQVLDVKAIPAASLQALPPLLAEADTEAVAAIATSDEELLFVLEGARLLPEALWEALEGPKP